MPELEMVAFPQKPHSAADSRLTSLLGGNQKSNAGRKIYFWDKARWWLAACERLYFWSLHVLLWLNLFHLLLRLWPFCARCSAAALGLILSTQKDSRESNRCGFLKAPINTTRDWNELASDLKRFYLHSFKICCFTFKSSRPAVFSI